MKEQELLEGINKSFKIMNNEYDNLIQEYLDFKAHANKFNQNKLLKQIKKFNYVKEKFSTKVKKLYIIGGKNK